MRPERIPVVDPGTNTVVDVRKRAVVRGFNLPHRATYVVVRHRPSNKLYVQERSHTKEYCPAMLDPAPVGVVSVDDQSSYEVNAAKEMEEEMSMTGLQLRFVGDFWMDTPQVRVWGRSFEAQYDVDPSRLRLQTEEVHAVYLMSEEEVVRAQARITPDGWRAFEVWRAKSRNGRM